MNQKYTYSKIPIKNTNIIKPLRKSISMIKSPKKARNFQSLSKNDIFLIN